MPTFQEAREEIDHAESMDAVLGELADGTRLARMYETLCMEDQERWRARFREIEENIRRACNLRSKDGSISYRDIVIEHPPVGSRFTTTGGYITPDGGYIPRELRMEVRRIKALYNRRDPALDSTKQVDESDFQLIGHWKGQPSKN